MKKTDYSPYRSKTVAGLLILSILFTGMGCTKTPGVEPVTPPYVNPNPPLSPPSGVIDTFYLTDTLVPFNTAGTSIKWSVSGTNNQTVVTINGVKFPFSGIIATGALKQTTNFTLTINNGKQAVRTLKVADSLTTNMWNKGKRLKIIKKEVYALPSNSAILNWVDTDIDPQVADERIYFSYFNTSEIYQKTANVNVALADGGRFVMHIATTTGADSYFTWRGNTYIITLLDANFMKVTYQALQPNGSRLKTRDTYQFE